MAAAFATFSPPASHAEPIAAGSALRGSRLLRRHGAWEEVTTPTKSAPSLHAEAAQLRSRLEAAKAEVERKHLAWSRVVSNAPEAPRCNVGLGDSDRLEARLAHAEADAEAQRKLADAAKLEVLRLQGLLEASRAEANYLRSCLAPQLDVTPESVKDEIITGPSMEELQRELAEVQRKLQDTASAWAAASAKNLELQQQIKAQPTAHSVEYVDQVVSQYERRVKDLMEQLQAKVREVASLKEKLSTQEVQLQKALHEPEKGLVNALEFEEQLSASHERRNTQLSEQLQAKRQEVAILKEHLQVKSEEIKQIFAAGPFQKQNEEDPTDRDKQLQALQAQQLLLKEQLTAQEEARQHAQQSEARVNAQVAELSTSLERQREAAAAGAKLLRAAQADCQEMWVVSQEREEERRRAGVLQQRMQEVQSRQQDMVSSWRKATAQAADLEAALELQHLAAVNVVEEQEVQRHICEGRSLELAAEVDEQQGTLSEMRTRCADLEAELRAETLRASRFQAESQRAAVFQAEASARLAEADSATREVNNLEEEARSMSERLELAEQFTEGYERRNSELAEQLTSKRKDLASLKARMAAKTAEHEEAVDSAETEAQEAAVAAAARLQTAEAAAKRQQQELQQLRSRWEWQVQEQQESEERWQTDLLQARQLQATSQAQARSEAEVALQLQRRLEDDGLSEARALAKMNDELATAQQRSLAAQAAQRQSVEQARAAELELEETTTALRRTEAAYAAAEADAEDAHQRCAAQGGQMETLCSELEASEARSVELEGALSQQLRSLDPSIGHSLRGVSVYHLSAQFLEMVLQGGLGMEASLEESVDLVARARTETTICPRDGLQGASYVDSIYGPENAGLATHLLSCSPRDAVGEVVGALEEFCQDHGLNPRQTYVWTCSLCVNLHRCPPRLPERIADFKRCGSRIGKVLVILMPWHKPRCLASLPSLCELWQALRLGEGGPTSPGGSLSPTRGRRNEAWTEPGGTFKGCEVTLLLPPRATQLLREDLGYGEDAILGAWRSLHGSWLEDAITVHEEQAPLLDVLGCGLNLFKADCVLTRGLQQWLAVTLEKQLRAMITNSELKAEEADRLFDAVGWMLWETGLRDLAGELLQDGLQLTLQSIFPSHAGRAAAASRLEVNKAMTNLEVFKLAGSLFERAGEQDTPSIATLLTHMGVAKGEAGDHQGAMEAFWHARRIRKVTGTLETVAGAVLLWNMGFALEQLGDFERAYEAYEAAKTLRRASGTLESAGGLRLQRAQLKLARLYGSNHVNGAERSPPENSPQSMVWERIRSPSTSLRSLDTPSNQFL